MSANTSEHGYEDAGYDMLDERERMRIDVNSDMDSVDDGIGVDPQMDPDGVSFADEADADALDKSVPELVVLPER